MAKVQWSVTLDYEFLPNYKLLQRALASLGITKLIAVDRLMKGRYQDHLDFSQFLYSLWLKSQDSSRPRYEAEKRRALARHTYFPDWAPTRREKTTRPSAQPSTRASSVGGVDNVPRDYWLVAKERDFYFSKLEDIERALRDDGVVEKAELLRILYSVDKLDGLISSAVEE